MILTLIAILAFCTIGYFLATSRDEFLGFLGAISVFVSLVALIIYIFSVSFWIGAEYKAELINKEFGTSYTQAQIFWADDVIEEIRQMKRQRIELNGNILQPQGDSK
jgi:hypothetical protein